MSKVVDITSRLRTEELFIKIGDKLYKVNNGRTNVLAVMKFVKESPEDDVEALEQGLDMLLGKGCVKKIEKDLGVKELSFYSYQMLIESTLEAATGNEGSAAEGDGFQKS